MLPVLKISTWEVIWWILSNLEKEIWKIIYWVWDWWCNLKKWLRLSWIKHTYDITHKLACWIEKIYKENEEYKALTKAMAKSRKKYYQTIQAHLIPTKQRSKSRFQNIDIISSWWIKILWFLSKKCETEEEKNNQNKFKWVLKYKDFIIELGEINNALKKIQKLIKTRLLSIETADEAIRIISELSWEKAKTIQGKLETYFNEIFELLEWQQGILATSDIIESSFWKYKNYLSDNCMAGITDLSLLIPTFTSDLNKNEIKESLESTTYEKMKESVKDFIWSSLLKLRRDDFKWYWGSIQKEL